MSKLSFQDFAIRDIYVYYDYEEVFYRYEYKTKRHFLKLLGSDEEFERPHNNRLVNEAILSGEEISEEQYLHGKPPLPN